MELDFKGLEIQKRNVPMYRAQRVDEENGVICPVIMVTPKVIIIEMSKMALFFTFSADGSKKSVTVCANYLSASEKSYLALSENSMVYWIMSYH